MPVPSSADIVIPPVLEEKNVVATFPRKRTTRFLVPVTAFVTAGVSASIPP